jgi:energy-coupling factor transporter ATP-binding protein EcfA2
MKLESFLNATDRLAALVPELLHLLGDREKLPTGWSALLERAGALRRQGGRLALVATLYGPTGAGKSTLFRNLTGIEVPAGDEIRPLSRGCAMAVPDQWDQADREPALRAVLPGFDLRPLDRPERLRQEDGQGLVWYRSAERLGGESRSQAKADAPGLFLVDVPDFNSLEIANHERAERVLRRAEVVVFVVTGDSYADQKVVEELARCCQVAARLVILITKVASPEKAQLKWADLLNDKLTRTDLPWRAKFQGKREDGRTLEAFLRECPVHAWPFSAHPTLEDLRPVTAGAPTLASLLLGLDAEKVAAEGLLQAGASSAEWVGQLAGRADAARGERQRWRASLDEDLARAGLAVAGHEFPIGRTLEVLMEEARAGQNQVFRWITYPFSRISAWMQGGFQMVTEAIRSAIRKPTPGGELVRLEDAERKSLKRVAEELVDKWRDRWPAWVGSLDSGQCRKACDTLGAVALASPQTNWEEALRLSARDWVEKHPTWAHTLPVVLDLTTVGGLGLFVLDISTTGGLLGSHVVLGSLGAGGLVAGGAGLAAMLARMADNMHFKSVLEDADRAWREQRGREIAEHLRQHLLPGILGDKLKDADRLTSFPVEEMRRLAGELTRKPTHD